MGLTLSQLEAVTLDWLDDPNGAYFSKARLDTWINNAQHECQKLLLLAEELYYVKPVQTTLVVNQNEYVLPSDFLELHRLELVTDGSPPNENTVPLSPMTMNQQDLVPNHTGTPQFYFLKRNRLVVFPWPDTPLTLRLYYSYEVADMVLPTDLPDIPDEYHEFLAVLASIDGMLKDQRDPSAMIMKRGYYEAMLKNSAEQRRKDASRAIVVTGEGQGFSFGYF